jgi:hypothetical protein
MLNIRMNCAQMIPISQLDLYCDSFAQLEVALVVESKLLFEEPPQNSFFVCLLQGKSHCICELYTPEKIVGTKPLSNNLLLQMDKYVKSTFVGISFIVNYKGCV